MTNWLDRLASLSPSALAAWWVGGVGFPLVLLGVTPPGVDVAMVAASSVGATLLLAAAYRRRQLVALPLELADAVLSGRIDGHHAFRFRAWLGHGRCMRRPTAEITFEGAHGTVRLEALGGRSRALVGPWTLVVVDRAGACGGPGTFRVRVRAIEGDRVWEAERSWSHDAVRPGTFAPGMSVRAGRLEWEPARFGEVVAPEVP